MSNKKGLQRQFAENPNFSEVDMRFEISNLDLFKDLAKMIDFGEHKNWLALFNFLIFKLLIIINLDQMKFRILLIVNAIVFGFSGILALLFPTIVLSLYGIDSGPAVQLMAQYAGLGSLAIALVALFGINLNDPKAQFTIKLQQAVQQQMGTNARMNIDVERHPQFQEEWRRTAVQMDEQYLKLLEEFKLELHKIK